MKWINCNITTQCAHILWFLFLNNSNKDIRKCYANANSIFRFCFLNVDGPFVAEIRRKLWAVYSLTKRKKWEISCDSFLCLRGVRERWRMKMLIVCDKNLLFYYYYHWTLKVTQERKKERKKKPYNKLYHSHKKLQTLIMQRMVYAGSSVGIFRNVFRMIDNNI